MGNGTSALEDAEMRMKDDFTHKIHQIFREDRKAFRARVDEADFQVTSLAAKMKDQDKKLASLKKCVLQQQQNMLAFQTKNEKELLELNMNLIKTKNNIEQELGEQKKRMISMETQWIKWEGMCRCAVLVIVAGVIIYLLLRSFDQPEKHKS